MPKELRISATIEVPDDIWGQTDKLAAAKPVVEAFKEAIEQMGGKLEIDLVVPRPKGADKGDAAAQYAALGGKMAA